MLYLNLNVACENVTGQSIPDDIMKIIYQYVKTLKYNTKIEKLFHINNITLQDYIDTFCTYNVKTLKQIRKDDKIGWTIEGTGGTGGYVKVDYVDSISIYNYENELRKKLNELKADNICLKCYRKNKPIGKKYYEAEEMVKAIDIHDNNKKTHLKNIDIQFQELYKQYVIDNPNANLPPMATKYTKLHKISGFTDFHKSRLLNKTIYSYKTTNYNKHILYYNSDFGEHGTYDPRYKNAGGAIIKLI